MKNYLAIFLNFLNNNQFFIILFFSILSIISLSIAYIAQYIYKIMPCKLCMYSRIPFIIMSLLPIIFYIPIIRNNFIIGFFIIFLSTGANIIISFYHIGVENSWFKPSLCKIQLNDDSKYRGELYNFLLGDESSLNSCENPTFKLFGVFSFASLNLIFSIVLFMTINFFIFNKFFSRIFKLNL
jgi:disulfide bond formation protein DsbB